MNKLKSLLDPIVEDLLLKSCPVQVKRSPLWFFKTETILSLKTQEPSLKRISASTINERWRNLDLETKRKYFKLARVDELRIKEQKTLWIAEVGTALVKHGDDKAKIKEVLLKLGEKLSRTDEGFSRYENNYQHMLQVVSTVDMYKNIIDNSNHGRSALKNPEELLDQVPDCCKSIMSKPRRPSTSFVLFVADNLQDLTRLRKEHCPEMSPRNFYAQQWIKLSDERKKYYRDKYARLLEEYNQAMDDYKSNIKDNYLEQAMKEKTRSSKCLRRKLREYSLTPLNVRNPFNFFVHANAKEATGLSSAWRDLPAVEKKKFYQLYQQDLERYQREKEVYNEITQALEVILKQKKTLKRVENESTTS